MVSPVGFNSASYGNVNFCANNGNTAANINAGELKDCLLERDTSLGKTENGNTYKKTNTSTIIGTILGFASPIVSAIIKNKGLSGLITKNWKTLAISCPALGLAGLVAGALIDKIVNTKNAQKADEQANPQDLADTKLGVDTVA